jgi:hypothetical protein
VGGGELDFDSVAKTPGRRPEKRARRLADARGNAPGVAGPEVYGVDLIEGIARLAFALENEALPVGRPVALARPFAFDRETADARQEIPFLIGRLRADRERRRQDPCAKRPNNLIAWNYRAVGLRDGQNLPRGLPNLLPDPNIHHNKSIKRLYTTQTDTRFIKRQSCSVTGQTTVTPVSTR